MTLGDEATAEDRSDISELRKILTNAMTGGAGIAFPFHEAAMIIYRVCIRGFELAFRDAKR